ncbi:hypothetical protein [Paenibacillus pinistramenti]|uniref:hypothetical protein n=1 Tax=Paenibacillus pinistramenti TaxID=1768003 RepID=UPI001109A590|nr:hypothetical protein [Paenibacillus pinistramenti]
MLTKLQCAGAALMLTAALTTGIAYASPKAGDSLQTWYQKSYNQAVKVIAQKQLKQGETKLDQTAQQVSAAGQRDGRSELLDYQRQRLDQIRGKLNQQKEAYSRQVDAARAELLGRNGAVSRQFANYTGQVTGQLDEQLELEAGSVLDSLLEQPETAGPPAVYPKQTIKH